MGGSCVELIAGGIMCCAGYCAGGGCVGVPSWAARPASWRWRSSSCLRRFSSSFFLAFHSLRISLNSVCDGLAQFNPRAAVPQGACTKGFKHGWLRASLRNWQASQTLGVSTKRHRATSRAAAITNASNMAQRAFNRTCIFNSGIPSGVRF